MINVMIILVLTFSIFAAGSGTGEVNNQDSNQDLNNSEKVGSENNLSNNSNVPSRQKNMTRIKARININESEKQKIREVCEDKTDREERIKCRLQYIRDHKEEFVVSGNGIPEACRDLTNKAQCIQLHQLSRKCYEIKGIEKNKCFKRLIGFARAKLKDENPSERGEKARKYVVLLLYDLQEKLEKAIENEKIDVEKGTEAINKIVEMKEDILAGKSKQEIKPMFQELKKIINELKEEIDSQNG